ncbi:CheA signal transduction histidine kinase [Candidatus Moduliflexus flocculans]|uniref:Chemotaxis protein CheA n=1 Tax=Candidatus Moduliflexus flocculans TaxID=1499966 RepID=A0A081BQ35_9BACT|nr:CheA signal transduction histidine kinase [Candidatus Moduliflexus flocculans]
MIEEHLIREFIAEAEEHALALEPNLLRLEKEPHNLELVNEIFIATHSIKGTASYVGLNHVSSFTHSIESLLDRLRKQQISATPALIDILLQGVDTLKLLIQHISSGKPAPDTSSVEKLLLEWDAKHESAEILQPAPQTTAPSVITLFGASVDPEDAEVFADIVAQQVEFLSISLEKLRSQLATDPAHAQQALAPLVKAVATVQSSAALLDIDDLSELIGKHHDYLVSLETPDYEINLADFDEISNMIKAFRDISAVLTSSTQSPAPTTASQTPALSSDRMASLSPVDLAYGQHILRVNAERVDALMNFVGELVINRARFAQIGQELKTIYDDLRSGAGWFVASSPAEQKNYARQFKKLKDQFDNITLDLGRITNQMQEGTMRIRMVPVAQIVNRFPRMVRDLSRQAGKEVDVRISGAETELDKTVVDVLSEPLIHLIRNAIDHGIEPPQERLNSGKPRQGTIAIIADHEGNQVLIEIQDDGRGIDVERVKKQAIRQQLVSAKDAENLGERDIISLIFHSGFSTVESVSNLSGRGVGLNVVKRYIEKINGSIEVISLPQKGCRFIIKLPLTLAIISVLIVEIQQKIFAIPLVAVEEAVRIIPRQTKTIKSQRVMFWREHTVSLFALSELFGDCISESHGSLNVETANQEALFLYVVILTDGFRRIGVIVNRLIGEDDIVLKPLTEEQTNVPGIAGAYIRGDGEVSLVIDVSTLINLAEHQERQTRRISGASASQTFTTPRQRGESRPEERTANQFSG